MGKALYQKYACTEIVDQIYKATGGGSYGLQEYDRDSTNLLYTEYILDEKRGYILSGYRRDVRNFQAGETGYRQIGYQGDGSQHLRFEIRSTGLDTAKRIAYMAHYNKAELRDRITYSKGNYISDVIAENVSLPSNGRHSDGYWYIFVKLTSDLKVNVGGVWHDVLEGYVNVSGVIRPQSEFKVNVEGIWK